MIQSTQYNNIQKEQIKKIFKTIRAVIPKDLLPEVSEWAEKNRFMTSKVSNITGAFSYENKDDGMQACLQSRVCRSSAVCRRSL